MKKHDDSEFDDDLMAIAAQLPHSVAPERDLWPDIERQLVSPAGARETVWNSVWAQAAAVLLLVGGSSAITYNFTKSEQPVVIAQTQGLLFETVSSEFGGQYSLGSEYLDARSQLEVQLEAQLQSLSPEARNAVVNNLNMIRIAIRDINEKLAKEPDNALLKELLLTTYHEEMSLMRKVDGIANAAMRRDDI